MRYSVFDWYSTKYRIFEDTRQYMLMSDPKSCAPLYRNAIGVDVNAALCPVPNDAKFVGWSDVAQGQVSRLGNGALARSNGNVPNLGGVRAPLSGPLGFMNLGQAVDRPLTFAEAIAASTVISIASGLISAWFFKRVRVPL